MDNTIPSSVAIAAPDFSQIGAAQRAARLAEGTVVTSPVLLQAAGDDLRRVKVIRDNLEGQRTTLKKPILEAGRAIDAFFKEPIAFCDKAIDTLKRATLAYTTEQDRIALEKQAAADRAAREERERIQAEADAARAAGDHEQADVAQAIADTVVAPLVRTVAPTPAGITTTKRWDARITNPAELLRHIADNPELHGWVEFKTSAIVAFGRSMQGMAKVPGVEFVQQSGLAVRRG